MKTKIIKKYIKSIYSEESINRAIVDYKDICDVSITGNEKYVECTFSNFKYEKNETVLEFSNYLIEIMNSRRN